MKRNKVPSVAIGHVILKASDLKRSLQFYRTLGLRSVYEGPHMAILEMRGGTHLMLFRGKPKPGPIRTFDFMVDRIRAYRDALKKVGIGGSRIRHDHVSGHRTFELTDPDGHEVKVYSSHTGGRPV